MEDKAYYSLTEQTLPDVETLLHWLREKADRIGEEALHKGLGEKAATDYTPTVIHWFTLTRLQ